MLEESITSSINLAPLKPSAKVHHGIKISHHKHSEHGGGPEQSDPEQKEKDLLEESIASSIDLAPLKPSGEVPLGIRISHH